MRISLSLDAFFYNPGSPSHLGLWVLAVSISFVFGHYSIEQSIDIILCLILIIAFEHLVLGSKCSLYSMMWSAVYILIINFKYNLCLSLCIFRIIIFFLRLCSLTIQISHHRSGTLDVVRPSIFWEESTHIGLGCCLIFLSLSSNFIYLNTCSLVSIKVVRKLMLHPWRIRQNRYLLRVLLYRLSDTIFLILAVRI